MRVPDRPSQRTAGSAAQTLASINGLSTLTAAQLVDGPWCPDAINPTRWDADLLGIRRVAITIRVEAALSALRGPPACCSPRRHVARAGPMGAGSGFASRCRRATWVWHASETPRVGTGVAILVAIMALLLMAAIGGVLILTSSSETIIAAHFRDSIEAR